MKNVSRVRTVLQARILGSLAGRAIAAGLDVIWFDEDKDGVLTEITYWGMHGRLKRAANKSGIELERLIHGARHHAGTQVLRFTHNLAAAQKQVVSLGVV